MAQYTKEQIYLLECLIYQNGYTLNQYQEEMANSGSEMTVGDYINKLKEHGSNPEYVYSIEAILNDKELLNTRILATHTENLYVEGGNSRSAVFGNPETGEAVVAFQGTASDEWLDDFKGGTVTNEEDGVSTEGQVRALRWYQEVMNSKEMEGYDYVTVTGHSKGGNKAKYITILDDSVDRCVSFDGQGFSDEFYKKYAAEIASRQEKIHNHNARADYVNLLLNDLGETTYYDHSRTSTLTDFKYFHHPATLVSVDENGNIYFRESEDGQNPVLRELDELLNGFLRTVSDEDREKALMMVGEIAELFLGGYYNGEKVSDEEKLEYLQTILENPEYDKIAGMLVAYTLKFMQERTDDPVISDAIKQMAKNHEALAKIIQELLSSETLMDKLLSITAGAGTFIAAGPEFTNFLHITNISEEDRKLLWALFRVLASAKGYYQIVEVRDGGLDQRLPSLATLRIDFRGMQERAAELEGVEGNLDDIRDDISNIINSMHENFFTQIKAQSALRTAANLIGGNITKVRTVRNRLSDIMDVYQRTENAVKNL